MMLKIALWGVGVAIATTGIYKTVKNNQDRSAAKRIMNQAREQCQQSKASLRQQREQTQQALDQLRQMKHHVIHHHITHLHQMLAQYDSAKDYFTAQEWYAVEAMIHTAQERRDV